MADIRRFLTRSARRQPFPTRPLARPTVPGIRADGNLKRLFAFVDRWATRSRIEEKLARLETLDPAAFGSLAPRIEGMVDEALGAIPGADREPSRPRIRLTWAFVALTIVLVLIAFGQIVASLIRT